MLGTGLTPCRVNDIMEAQKGIFAASQGCRSPNELKFKPKMLKIPIRKKHTYKLKGENKLTYRKVKLYL